MMTCRTISRVLPMVTIIFVGSAYSVDVLSKVDANKATLGAIAFGTALPQDADAAKAAVETAGVVLDNSSNKMNLLTVPVNFAVNWGVRKAMRGMGANKLKLSGFGSTGNDVVGTMVEAVNVATPQIVAALVVMAINGSTASSK